jgi:hypothetical protein
MANKVQFPGLGKSAGIDRGDYLFDKGDYKIKFMRPRYSEIEEKHLSIFNVKGRILDGPKQDNGDDVKNRMLDVPIFFLHEDHPSYNEEMDMRSLGELKSCAVAAGAKYDKSDNLDLDSFVDAEIWVRVTQNVNKKTGEPKNRIVAYAVDKADLD